MALGLEEGLRRIAVNPLRKEIRHWRTGKTWNWYNLGTASASATARRTSCFTAAISTAFWSTQCSS